MIRFNCTYTDTFGGEANYAWVSRVTIKCADNASQRAIMRKAKDALGLTGVRGTTEQDGDGYIFRPHGFCTILFIEYDGREQKLVQAMARYGGGFASNLAIAWTRADLENQRKLRAAFGDMLESFAPFIGEEE
jgi:hypothetical protein